MIEAPDPIIVLGGSGAYPNALITDAEFDPPVHRLMYGNVLRPEVL